MKIFESISKTKLSNGTKDKQRVATAKNETPVNGGLFPNQKPLVQDILEITKSFLGSNEIQEDVTHKAHQTFKLR